MCKLDGVDEQIEIKNNIDNLIVNEEFEEITPALKRNNTSYKIK